MGVRGYSLALITHGMPMLKLEPNPTFKAPVVIPTPDGDMTLEVEFKHMTRAQFDAYLKAETEKKRPDEEAICEFVVGWSGIDAAFSTEALAKLVQNYHASATRMFRVYIEKLTQAASGN
jgi:hypothetical protein